MITLDDSAIEACVKLSAGNPGAATVCARILLVDPVEGFVTLCHMDDMGLTGSDIWIGFKDFAKQDLAVFIAACDEHSPAMLQVIRDGRQQP